MSAEIISIVSAANARRFGEPADALIEGYPKAGWVQGQAFIYWSDLKLRYLAVELIHTRQLRMMERGVYHHGLRCDDCGCHGMDLSTSSDCTIIHIECTHCGKMLRRTVPPEAILMKASTKERRCLRCGTFTHSQHRICRGCEHNTFRPNGQWCELHGPTDGDCFVCDLMKPNGGDAA